MHIEYGWKITTTQTTLTDYSLGLVAGVLQWVTGRPAIDGWKEGILTEGSMSEVSQEIELSAGGSYATMSGASVAIDNSDSKSARIKALGLNLIPADAVFYSIRDGVFSQDWTGKVGDISWDEQEIKIQLMDAFRGIHKPNLTIPVALDQFPDATDSEIGKYIPVIFGLVRHAKILNVSSKPSALVCNSQVGIDLKVCACTAYDPTLLTVTLKTGSHAYAINDPQLVGKYLTIIKGADTLQSRKILSNAVSVNGTLDTGTTVVTLSDAYDLGSSTRDTGLTTSLYWSLGHKQKVWFFEINQFDVSLLVSNLPIYKFELTAAGREVLEYYDTDAKRYVDVGDIQDTSSLSSINSLGYPGISIISKRVGVGGDVSVYFNIVPSSISYVSLTDNAQWTTTPTSDGSANKNRLIDDNQSTEVTLSGVLSPVGTTVQSEMVITFDLQFPTDSLDLVYSALYMLVDQHVKGSLTGSDGSPPTSYHVDVTVKLFGEDLYGSLTDQVNSNNVIHTTTRFISTPLDQITNQLPNAYYGLAGNNASFYALKTNSDIQSLVDDLKASIAYPVVRIELHYLATYGGSGDLTFHADWTIQEIGIVGAKTLNVVSTDLYKKVQGGIFGSTWGGRKTASNPVKNPVDMAELVVRTYDGRPDVIDTAAFDAASGWRAAWFFGNQADGSKDSYSLIVELCRFGFFGMIPRNNGTRAAKAWMNIAPVATHSDTNGTIIEKTLSARMPTSLANLHNDIQVNYAWNPGSQKYDKFFQITKIDQSAFPASSALLRAGVSLGTFSLSYSSLGGGSYLIFVATDNPHNLFSGDFTSLSGNADGYNYSVLQVNTVISPIQFTVTVHSLPTAASSSSGTLVFHASADFAWKQYALGFSYAQYSTAAALWALCHDSWTKYGVVQKLPDDMANGIWFPDVVTDWGLTDTNNAALLYLKELCNWTPFRKDVITYHLPNTATHATLELLDRITFNDSVMTNGVNTPGWIVRKAVFPGLGKDYIEIGLMLTPETSLWTPADFGV